MSWDKIFWKTISDNCFCMQLIKSICLYFLDPVPIARGTLKTWLFFLPSVLGKREKTMLGCTSWAVNSYLHLDTLAKMKRIKMLKKYLKKLQVIKRRVHGKGLNGPEPNEYPLTWSPFGHAQKHIPSLGELCTGSTSDFDITRD